jgi:hypothetical protein
VLNTKKAAYTLTRRMKPGDLTNVYSGFNQDKKPIIAKITRMPSNNDLVRNEAEKPPVAPPESKAKALRVMQHIPVLVDSFELDANKVKKQVNIYLAPATGYVSVEDVIERFPSGIPLEKPPGCSTGSWARSWPAPGGPCPRRGAPVPLDDPAGR